MAEAEQAQKDVEADKTDAPVAAVPKEGNTGGVQADVAAEVADTAAKLDSNAEV